MSQRVEIIIMNTMTQQLVTCVLAWFWSDADKIFKRTYFLKNALLSIGTENASKTRFQTLKPYHARARNISLYWYSPELELNYDIMNYLLVVKKDTFDCFYSIFNYYH